MSPAEIMLLLCRAMLGLSTALSVLSAVIAAHGVILLAQLVIARRTLKSEDPRRTRKGAR